MRKPLVILLIAIILITAILVIVGFVFNQPEDEKQQGLTDIFDVSSNGTIAYVVYEKGKAGIYFKNDKEAFNNPVLQLTTEQVIQDIDFSPDGSSLAYIVANKDVESNLESAVHVLTMKTLEENELFRQQALITEIDFDPKDQQLLFYLQADTFENYSPIASAHPHEFDLYSYHISDNEHSQHTEMNKYSMGSLNVSSNDYSVFIQMDDDAHVETADDIFEAKQKVFQISLDQSEDISIISKNDRNEDIYDFTVVPNKTEMIFQSVSRTGEKGIFEYELFLYNWESDQENQLTYLKESANRPVLGPENDKVFFIVDYRFGKRHADYHLYQMDLASKDVEEVSLDLGF